jgi:hypothetical protein
MGRIDGLRLLAYEVHARKRTVRREQQDIILSLMPEQQIQSAVLPLEDTFNAGSLQEKGKFFHHRCQQLIIHGLQPALTDWILQRKKFARVGGHGTSMILCAWGMTRTSSIIPSASSWNSMSNAAGGAKAALAG